MAQLLNITDDYMTLMSDNGDIREDLRVPDNEVGKEIMAKFQANEEFYVSPAPLFGGVGFVPSNISGESLNDVKSHQLS